jgi:hypothetical protein
MTFGLLALNNNNQVLVSSDTRNLHLIAKLDTPFAVDYTTDYYGGIRILRYRVTCSVYPVPFFSMPTADFYGVTRITSAGSGVWDIELIRSGTSNTYPTVYVFADPRAGSSSEQFGMVVYRNDGTPAFDSRLRPLAVTGGLGVVQPSNPRPTFPYNLSARYCGSDLSASGGFFQPTEYNSYSVPGQPSAPIFFYSSLAQAEREAHYHDSDSDCLGSDKFGVCITRTVYDWNSWYWCFYRGGIKWTGSGIQAGWIPVEFGCNYRYDQDDSLIGIGIGGDSGGGGSWPYSNETINLDASTVMIADKSRYD